MKIVVGMHRSGTSVLMNLLQRAGADLGDPAGFYPCDRWNPDGYFEQQEILTANRKLLHGPLGRLAFFSLPASTRSSCAAVVSKIGYVRSACATTSDW